MWRKTWRGQSLHTLRTPPSWKCAVTALLRDCATACTRDLCIRLRLHRRRLEHCVWQVCVPNNKQKHSWPQTKKPVRARDLLDLKRLPCTGVPCTAPGLPLHSATGKEVRASHRPSDQAMRGGGGSRVRRPRPSLTRSVGRASADAMEKQSTSLDCLSTAGLQPVCSGLWRLRGNRETAWHFKVLVA